ncbi:CapA family protein [Helicobacter aurati]|uniref:CapA family protein n=2 Tax=Helicobacter aurati TaxID=137778 RepID=A0A3D8JAA9_9HELI|nr:CapA family protein [Helicobacter aurati]
MGGDALLHTPVYLDAQKSEPILEDSKKDSRQTNKPKLTYDFSNMLALLTPIIHAHDLAFYNQESSLGGIELGLSSYPTFNSPQEFGDSMLQAGFNLISLANNHTLDKGEKGVRASLQYWKKQSQDNPILTAGSYESFEDRNTPRILERNGITYTLLAYTYGINGIPIPKGKEHLVNVYTKEMLRQDIASIREKVDLLIVSMHWGIEYTFTPTQEQKEIATLLAELGVNIVIGNHPHVIQPIESINDCLVIYSLGNMLSGQQGLERKIGMLVSVHIVKNKAENSHRESAFAKNITLQDIKVELIYTYHDKKKRNFKIIPFSKLDEITLPKANEIKNKYLKTIGLDRQTDITIGINH